MMPSSDDDAAGEDGCTVTAAAAYVLQAMHACHQCGCIVPVFALLIEGPFAVQGESPLDADDCTALLTNVLAVPDELGTAVQVASGGSWRLDRSRTAGETYYMNHCPECGAKLGDWFLSKPEAAFFPLNEEGIRRIRGRRHEGPFIFESPNLALSSWTDVWLRIDAVSRPNQK